MGKGRYGGVLAWPPISKDVYLIRGRAFKEAGDYEKALNDFWEALALHTEEWPFIDAINRVLKRLDGSQESRGERPVMRKLHKRSLLVAALNTAWDVLKKGYGFSRVLRTARFFWRRYSLLKKGQSLFEAGDYNGAIESFSSLLSDADTYMHDYFYECRAAAYEAKGDDKAALSDYEAALRLYSKLYLTEIQQVQWLIQGRKVRGVKLPTESWIRPPRQSWDDQVTGA